jgi:YVTN family beta-propeller protein
MTRRGTQQNSAALRRAARRWLAPAIAVTAALWGLRIGPAQAQQFLACGVPMTHHLASGETDTYDLLTSGDASTIVDVIDTSGTIGLLQLSPAGWCPWPPACAPPTCTGSEDFGRPVAVSDCVGNDAGDYTIEFNVVQQSPENCGIPLSCGVAPAAALSVPGEVDAYTFAGVAGQQASLTATATSDATGSLRMRLFSPTGVLQSDSCSGSLTYNVLSTGTYTVLVSACITPATGPYTIVWQTLPACAAAAAAARPFGYVLYVDSRTVAVIDLTTNQTVSILTGVAPTTDLPNVRAGSITVSPNNGLAYVTLEDSGTISIINTTLNQVVGSIYLLGTDGLRVALDPEGRYAYAAVPVLGGIAVINTATRKVEAIIPVEVGSGGIGPRSAVTPGGKAVYVEARFPPPPGDEGHCESSENEGLACTSNSDCTGGGGGLCLELGLIVIDTASRTVAGRVTDPRFPTFADLLDISFNPTGTLAYVTYGYYGLYVIDVATRSVTQSLPLSGVSGIAYSHDGRVGYAASAIGGAGSSLAMLLQVIDMASLTITNTISLTTALAGGATGGGVALSPDGARLIVTNPDATAKGTLPAAVVIDTATLQVVGTIPAVGDGPHSVAIATPPTGLCTADATGQTRVTVGELVKAVNYAADGCPTARTSSFTAQ